MRKKEIIEFSATGVLVLVLLFAVGNAIKSAGKAKRPKTPIVASKKYSSLKAVPSQEKVTSAMSASTHKSIELFTRLEQEGKNLKIKRDPFNPSQTQSYDSFGGHLTGIIWDEEAPQAIINGKIVSVGDKIGANTIIEIKQDEVILSDGVQNFEIRVGQ